MGHIRDNLISTSNKTMSKIFEGGKTHSKMCDTEFPIKLQPLMFSLFLPKCTFLYLKFLGDQQLTKWQYATLWVRNDKHRAQISPKY